MYDEAHRRENHVPGLTYLGAKKQAASKNGTSDPVLKQHPPTKTNIARISDTRYCINYMGWQQEKGSSPIGM
jgi:hypothetical protein